MIRLIVRNDIPQCAAVIRESFRTVADEFGITEENAGLLKGTGIAGIAVVSAIFAQKDIREAAARLDRIGVWK